MTNSAQVWTAATNWSGSGLLSKWRAALGASSVSANQRPQRKPTHRRQLLCEPPPMAQSERRNDHDKENSRHDHLDNLVGQPDKSARRNVIEFSSEQRLRHSAANAATNKHQTTRPTSESSDQLFRSPATPVRQRHSNSNHHNHHHHHQHHHHHLFANREAQQRGRRKSELTKFLTILFGFISLATLILLLSQSGCASALVIGAAGNDTSSAAHNATSLAAAAAGDVEHDDDSAGDELPPDVDSSSSPNKLGNLMADLGSSGIDLLAEKLRANSGDSSELETTRDEISPDESADDSNNHKAAAAASATSHEEQQEQQLRLAMETYARWRATGEEVIELVSRKLMPLIVEHGYDVDSASAAGLLQVFNGIRGLKPWAVKLLDASAKLAPGILLGTQSDFGDFDECLNVRADDPAGLAANNPDYPVETDPETGLKSTTLVGRYCLADIEFPKPPRELLAQPNETSAAMRLLRSQELGIGPQKWAPIELRRPLLNFSQTAAYRDTIFVETGNFFHMLYVDPIRVGVCLTNKIDPDAFTQVLNKLLEQFRVTINFRGRCVTKYQRPVWTKYQQVSAWILSVACSLVALSTLLDLITDKLEHQANKLRSPKWRLSACRLASWLGPRRPLLTSFSLIRNTRRLFKDQQSADGNNLAAAELQHHSDRRPSGASVSCFQQQQQHLHLQPNSDSSVESSPSIERRSSSIDAGSSVELILNDTMARRASSSTSSSSSSEQSHCQAASLAAVKITRENGHDDSYRRANLQCLHGVRVITMTWMIVNHTYMFGGFFVLWAHRRLIDIAEWPKSLSFQLVLNGWLTVETYFFLSALIIVLNLLPLMKRKQFNYLVYVMHRLLRLLPAYVGLVCLNFLWPLVSSGPVWLVKGKSFVQEPCENYLWTNFLFVNNWIWPEKQCMVHTWFLSADFQLYLLAPLVVYLLYRRPVLGHSMNLLAAILASVFSGLVVYANQLLPTTLINKLEFDAIKQQLSYSYFATYQHVSPYCLGILIGYLMHTRPKIRLPNHLNWLLWLLLPPLSFTTLMLTYLWNGAYDEPSLINPSPLVSALYVAIHRTIWTSLVAWLVFACATGRANMLSSFLSHSLFIPISRLSYSVYLVHLPVIMYRALNLRHTVEWSDHNILWEACGNFIASLVMGFFVNVTFESPIINLENLLLRRGPSNRTISSANALALVKHNNLAHIGESALSQNLLNEKQFSAHKELPTLDSPAKANEKLEPRLPQGHEFSREADSDESAHAGESAEVSPDEEQTSSWPSEQTPYSIADQQKRDSLEENLTSTGDLVSNSSLALELQRVRRNEQRRLQADDIYNISAEYRHYAPGSYQQWRQTSGGAHLAHSRRPQQYATLARSDRLARNSSRRLVNLASKVDWSRQQRAGPLAIANSARQATESQLHRLMPISRHHGRYNTLTGTGSARDWRLVQQPAADLLRISSRDQHEPARATFEWPRQFVSASSEAPAAAFVASPGNSEPGQHHKQSGPMDALAAGWLKPGAMLPRIDSSTLRRQARQAEAPAQSSIVEEPAAEESSAL